MPRRRRSRSSRTGYSAKEDAVVSLTAKILFVVIGLLIMAGITYWLSTGRSITGWR